MAKVLSSWKEIGRYLGKSVRTVQRWERQDGLPVHRPKLATVLAHAVELDDWICNHPAQAATWLRRQDDTPALRHVSVLIVGDHPLSAELKKVLERAGCEVATAREREMPEAGSSHAEVILAIASASAMKAEMGSSRVGTQSTSASASGPS